MDNYIGKRLDGRYQVDELVGIGGMANVYKATDLQENCTVAIKVLREEFAASEEFLRRFKNESRAISILSHSNIVRVFDVNFSDNVNYIVMEYIDGITLKEYIEQQKALRWKEAVYFTVQILRALQHAHDRGIVHRDVKPQNIMLLADGSIKVTDFGIARFARSGMHTVTDKAIGSVHYISPEQARGEATDNKTDIYAVGVMLFEMLTGQLPFDAASPVSVALQQIQEQPRQPRALNPSIPQGLEEITMRAMEKDPRRRYQSAAEMLRDIDEFRRNPSMSFAYPSLAAPAMGPQPSTGLSARGASAHSHRSQGGGQKRTSGSQEGKARATKKKPSLPSGRRGSRPQSTEEETMAKSSKPLPIIPALAGIAAAFVVGTILFLVVLMRIHNPFQRVEDVVVPNLIGQKYDTVRTAEGYRDFFIEVESRSYSDEYEAGTIFEQKPNAGRTVKKGAKITVVVSEGQEIITMPNFVNQEATSVFAKLRSMNLEYKQVDIFSSSIPAGFVVSTSPASGSQVPAGTVVQVQVSMGADSKVVDVPDLGGMSLTEAKAALSAAGLNAGSITYKDSEAESGTVIGQDPGFNSQIAEGTYVNLTVSSGEEIINSVQLYVRMPDISQVVNVKATQDGSTVAEQQIQPSLVRIWRPSFSGQGRSTVRIYINEKLYQEYAVDFDSQTATPNPDVEAAFTWE